MTRLDGVIEDIKAVDASNHSWLFEDGKLKDDVVVGDVLPLLEELKEYEVDTTDDAIEKLVTKHDMRRWNTYNWGANITHELDCVESEINGYLYMAIMVHRFGDVRCNYTERFLVRFDDEYEWFELENRVQIKEVADRYIADIDIMSEGYNVYDHETGNDVGDFYDIEIKDLLKSIAEHTK